MRVLVADGFVPFDDEREGAAAELCDALRARGHEVDAIRLPRGDDPAHTALATRLTDISDVGELLVVVGRPAHLLRHPRKVIWCEDEAFARQDETEEGDRRAFAEAQQVAASSESARRAVLDWFSGEVDVLASADLLVETAVERIAG